MKEKEMQLVRETLAKNPTDEKMTTVCRQILSKRLQFADQPDHRLRILLEGIVDTMVFPVQRRVLEGTVPPKGDAKPNLSLVAAGMILIAGGILLAITDIAVLRVIGALTAAIGGCGAAYRKPGETPKPPRAILQVITTPEEISRQVDNAYEAMEKFYSYRQLDGRQAGILQWFQRQYSESDSDKYRESIKRLLKGFGYDLTDYTDEKSADFELYPGKVNKNETTMPAIFNEEGTLICKGIAVIPEYQ